MIDVSVVSTRTCSIGLRACWRRSARSKCDDTSDNAYDDNDIEQRSGFIGADIDGRSRAQGAAATAATAVDDARRGA